MKKLTQKLVNFEELKLPETVYKYRNWDDKFHKTILTDFQVYMSASSDFEDPLDCKNQVRYDLLTDEEIYSKYYLESLEDRPNLPESEHQKFANAWFNKSPVRNKEFIDKQQARDLLDFNERTGILCLTANPIRPEMWVKYSNNHEGFCVGFDPMRMFKSLGGGMEVMYCDELPIIKPTPWDDPMTQMIKQIYHKVRKWEFEEEYRTQKFSPNPLTKEERVVTLPVKAYKEIIFGAKISEKNKNDIVSIAKKQLPHLKFKQVEIHEDKIVLKELSF